ncbi:hypothetical protein QUB52_08900 [Microcoleus sp. A6-C6]
MTDEGDLYLEGRGLSNESSSFNFSFLETGFKPIFSGNGWMEEGKCF